MTQQKIYGLKKLIRSVLDDQHVKIQEKRHELNVIESSAKQTVFIKTNLCHCGKLDAELWVKVGSFTSH